MQHKNNFAEQVDISVSQACTALIFHS